MLLQILYEDDNYWLGIHRTPSDIDEIFTSYFVKGLENKKLEYDNTLSVFHYFPELLNEILRCNTGWKHSKGCLLVQIPKNPDVAFYRIDNEAGKEKYYILPTYIYGYLSVVDGQIEAFFYNSNYGKKIKYEENVEFSSDIYIRRKSKLGTRY